MIHFFKFLGVGLLIALSTFAGEKPVAQVTSGSPFELRGSTVNPAGVPNWPVAVGDEFATGSGPAVITFRDGSRVTLGQKSRAKLEKSETGILFRLLAGNMRFTRSKASTLQFYSKENLVQSQPEIETLAGTSTIRPAGRTPTPPPPGPGPVSTR